MRDMRACVCVLVQVAGYFIHGNVDVQRFMTLNIYMNEEAPIEYYIMAALPNVYGRYSIRRNGKQKKLSTND